MKELMKLKPSFESTYPDGDRKIKLFPCPEMPITHIRLCVGVDEWVDISLDCAADLVQALNFLVGWAEARAEEYDNEQ